MKNKYMTFVALVAAALATSCASDDLAEQKQNQGEPQTVTLTASMADDNTTRVGMSKGEDNTASFYWHSDDKILVQTVNNEAYSGAEFTTSATTGATDATFTGDVTGKVGTYAVYPYDSETQQHSFTSEKGLTFVLPANYTYNTVGNNIFSKGDTYPSNSTNMPMLGTIANGKISFKPLGGLAVIRIDEMPAASGTLTVTADQQLAGEFTVSDLSASDAKITNTATASDGDKTVSFTFGGPASGVGVFYLPLATGNYTNLKITIACGTDNATTQTIPYGSLSVARKSITAISLTTDSKGHLRHIVDNGNGSYTINGHEFVDLGLDVLWAKTNVGADTEAAYGGYFAWGNTEATKGGNSSYTDKTSLDAAHDAATANWGSAVRMPTWDEFKTLKSGCNVSYSSSGCTFTKNSQSIFFPIAGYYKEYTLVSTLGMCWSSTFGTTYPVYFYCTSSAAGIADAGDRNYNMSVRAVAEKPSTTD